NNLLFIFLSPPRKFWIGYVMAMLISLLYAITIIHILWDCQSGTFSSTAKSPYLSRFSVQEKSVINGVIYKSRIKKERIALSELPFPFYRKRILLF
ncbi:MAG: hypothetical protein K2I21_06760, partial [Acetatifactor sp.]|nr:hypothetical protein [Acetatifactor sp.]